MSGFDPSRPWEWSMGVTPGDEELEALLQAGEVVRAAVPGIGEVEVRLDGRTGTLEVWLETSTPPDRGYEVFLQEGGQAAIYALSGLGRDVRVRIRGTGSLRLGLEARWRFGQGVFTLWNLGAPREVPV